jgi:hypothetical protein
MENLKALFIGVLGGLIVLGISKAYRAYRVKSLKQDVELLEFEKKHLAEMKKSSVEMNRSSFRALFAVLMLIALANLIPTFLSFTGLFRATILSSAVSIVLWAMVFGLSVGFWRRYDNLKNFKEATKKIEEKLAKLRRKVEKVDG